jgi:peptidoglycan/xylan/chitin deacetylase (PgdA/CDA1 family)
MFAWKPLLRPYYYAATWPCRWWLRRVAEADHRAPVVVVMYHRIADDRATPWTVSNRTFVRQIDWLARRFDVIALEEAQRRLRVGDNTRMAVSITFDDGYAENCHQAIPLLVKRRIPCTYFVTVKNMLSGEPFEHDRALGLRLLPNNAEQLRAMAAAGIELGTHGYDHLDLARIDDPAELHRQVVEGGERLAACVERRVRYFAFPYGQFRNLSSRAMDLAYAAGYEAVCSGYGGYNFPGNSPFHLQRIPIDDSLSQLTSAVFLDPRKLHTPRWLWNPPRTAPGRRREMRI